MPKTKKILKKNLNPVDTIKIYTIQKLYIHAGNLQQNKRLNVVLIKEQDFTCGK